MFFGFKSMAAWRAAVVVIATALLLEEHVLLAQKRSRWQMKLRWCQKPRLSSRMPLRFGSRNTAAWKAAVAVTAIAHHVEDPVDHAWRRRQRLQRPWLLQ